MQYLKLFFKNKQLIYSIVIKIVQMVGGLVIIKLLSTYLTKGEFGYYSLMMAAMGLISVLPFSALNQGVLRFAADYEQDLKLFFSNTLVIYLIFIAIYFIILLVLPSIIEVDESWRSLIYLLPFVVITTTLFNFLTWYENAIQNQRNFAIILALDLLTKSIAIKLLDMYDVLTTEYVFIIFIFSSGLIFIVFIRNSIQFKLISFNQAKSIFFNILSYIYPILIWSVFIWAQGMIYRWYLNIFQTAGDVATFSIMSSLAILPITSITGVLGTYLLPKLFNQKHISMKSTFKKIVQTVLIVVVILSVMLLVIVFFNEEIVSLLTDLKYASQAWMLPFMFSAMIVYACGNILSYIILTERRTIDLLLPNIAPGFFAMTAGYFLIKNLGIDGALITFICTYVLHGLLNSIIVMRKVHRNAN